MLDVRQTFASKAKPMKYIVWEEETHTYSTLRVFIFETSGKECLVSGEIES